MLQHQKLVDGSNAEYSCGFGARRSEVSLHCGEQPDALGNMFVSAQTSGDDARMLSRSAIPRRAAQRRPLVTLMATGREIEDFQFTSPE